ncbi:MAG: hypothetical protein NDJ94_15305 [Vicinamibacteria bacterium]|nr:hypothetical protein [Vicinamibacteria bacterium]
MRGARGAGCRTRVVGIALTLLALTLSHGPTLAENFGRRHWEDRRFFVHNRNQVGSWSQAFTVSGAWPGLYRPLSTNVYYRAGRLWWDNRIEVYQAINAALLGATALLLLELSLRVLPTPAAFLPPLLMASRRASAQLPLESCEFQGLSAGVLSLLAFLLWTRGVERGSRALEVAGLGALAAALLCKESAVSTVALFALHGLLARWPASHWRRLAAPIVLTAGWALLAVGMIASFEGRQQTGFEYDAGWGLLARLVGLALLFVNAAVRVEPDGEALPASEYFEASHLALAVFVVTSALAAAALGLLAHLRGKPLPAAVRVAILGAGWFVAAALPYTILVDRLFPRYALLAHLGLALAAGGLLAGALEAVSRAWAARAAWLGRFRRLDSASRPPGPARG